MPPDDSNFITCSKLKVSGTFRNGKRKNCTKASCPIVSPSGARHSWPMTVEAPSLEFFKVGANPPPVVPALGKRAWMDATHARYAYRCIPMTIANASGWEVRCPFAFDVTWNGDSGLDAISLTSTATPAEIEALVGSHFGHGIITFHTGWLVRTSPGWATWARGAPNWPKDNISALEGLVETDWLPFPFTMNWRFSRPGTVRFEADEPYCFMTPVPHAMLDTIAPNTRQLDDDPELAADYRRWQTSRADFNQRLQQNEREAVEQGWQRHYVRKTTDGPLTGFHITKRALRKPQ